MSTTQERIQRYMRQLAPHQRDREAAQLLEESFKQLEAANQRELELLAVIEKMRSALLPYCDGDCPDYDAGGISTSHWAAARAAMTIVPSQALREDVHNKALVLNDAWFESLPWCKFKDRK